MVNSNTIKEVDDLLVVCVSQMAITASNDLLWKSLNHEDYAIELDETRIRNAAHLMVASLAGSLAHVTYKEPLCGSILSQLRNSLQGLNIASELEQAVQLVTNNKLDLGCALIEQAATKKVLRRPYLFLSRRKLATHVKIWLNKCGLRGRADQSSLDTTTTILSSHNIVLTKPDNVEMVEWKAFVKQRTSKEFKAKSKRFRAMRKKQTLLHTMSRKGYARLKDEMINLRVFQVVL